MSGIRDRPQAQAQAPRPYMPKLANAPPPTFPRSPPKPRLGMQTLSPSITATLQSRRPLTVVNTPPVSRPSSSNGRPAPPKPALSSNLSPRVVQTSVMTPKSISTYTPPSATDRPRLARGVTSPLLPSGIGRANVQPRRGNAPFLSGTATRTASPISQRPAVAAKRTQTSPAAHNASFFHADEVPVRSSSPDLPSLDSMVDYVHSRTTKNEAPQSVGSISADPLEVPTATTNPPAKLPGEVGHGFIDAASAHKLKAQDTVKLQGISPVNSQSRQDEVNRWIPSTPTSPFKHGKHNSENAFATRNVPSPPRSNHPSNNGQRRQSSLDITANPPNHGKARSTSIASNLAAFKASQMDGKPASVPSRSGLQPNRNSTSSIEPTSHVLVDPVVPSSIDSPQPVAEPDPVSGSGGIAATARHERKLLDLEISNSSLLAINRTLEREVAKQKSELKRFRRATFDRTSWISDGTEDSSEVGSRVSVGGEEESFIDEHEIGSDGQTLLSNNRRVSRPRLQLDFSKQKEFLIENQKMNLALQKCLSITDKLIKDGDTALEYQVDMFDLDIEADHSWDDDHLDLKKLPSFQTRFNPGSEKPSAAESFFQTWGTLSTRTFSNNPDLESEPTDRDSGIDVGYMNSGLASTSRTNRKEAPGTPLEELEKEMF